MIEQTKTIEIKGTTNRYKIKKMCNAHPQLPKIKKNMTDNLLITYEQQLHILQFFMHTVPLDNTVPLEMPKKIMQHIKTKICSYMNQDKQKINKKNSVIKIIEHEKYAKDAKDVKDAKDDDKINPLNICKLLYACQLMCYYCAQKMELMHFTCNQGNQWTVDRIDNEKFHTLDNIVISCLDCNVKKRKRSHAHFLLGKQISENARTIIIKD